MSLLLFKTVFGSQLYGTDTPNSDQDFRGVFLPSTLREHYDKKRSIFEKTKKDNSVKNNADDVDIEIYTLKYFLYMAVNGNTPAIDMLHANENHWVDTSKEWRYIHENRNLFYSRKFKSFIGYAQQQAAKYGLKGSRLENSIRLANILHTFPEHDLVCDHPDISVLADSLDHCSLVSQNGENYVGVCGKLIPVKARIGYACEIVDKFVDTYGTRARQAMENEGVDWKAVSHAFRGAFQVKEIINTGDLKYPLKDRAFLIDIKTGKYEYPDISKQLEDLIDETEELLESSDLPNNASEDFWDDFFFEVAEQKLKLG